MSSDAGEVTEGSENEQSSFSDPSIASFTSQLILWSFRCFTYVTAHSPTLPLLHLRHSSFSNPSVASPTSQLIFLTFRRFTYVIGTSPKSLDEPPLPISRKHLRTLPWVVLNGRDHYFGAGFYHSIVILISCRGGEKNKCHYVLKPIFKYHSFKGKVHWLSYTSFIQIYLGEIGKHLITPYMEVDTKQLIESFHTFFICKLILFNNYFWSFNF